MARFKVASHELNIQRRMEKFPHFTALENPGMGRLQGLLRNLEEEPDLEDLCAEETIFKNNFKSWVYWSLGYTREAETLNTLVIREQAGNVMALANQVFILWRAGKEVQALKCLDKLEDEQNSPDFKKRLATAQAELAYSFSRLGGPKNMQKAIDLLKIVVGQYPEEFYWKLRLGLVYRRCTHMNLFAGMSTEADVVKFTDSAAQLLFEVAQNSPIKSLRAPAWSELATLSQNTSRNHREHYPRVFGDWKAQDLCQEALRLDDSNTWVLTACGKVLRTIDVDRAINVLQKSLVSRPHSTVHHVLGLCFEKKWNLEKSRFHSREQRNRGATRGGHQTYRGNRGNYLGNRGNYSANRGNYSANRGNYSGNRGNYSGNRGNYSGNRGNYSGNRRSNNNNASIENYPEQEETNLMSENVRKAEEAFQKAITLSSGSNMPAINSLGLLYMATGRVEQALEQFNKITNDEAKTHLLTLIKANKNAGLCYLKLPGREEIAESKLTMAVGLAASLASSCTDEIGEFWEAFRTIEKRLQSRSEELIQLYELVNDHRSVIKVVQQISAMNDSELDDPILLTKVVKSYMQLGESESALAFLNMISLRSNISHSPLWGSQEMKDLKTQVLVSVAKKRLQRQSPEARLAFQELFKLHYGRCAGQLGQENEDMPGLGDVLLFYDEDLDAVDYSPTRRKVRQLQQVFAVVYGLDVSINLQSCTDYGPQINRQLEEMARCQAVVVVLGDEARNPEFQGILEMMPHLLTDGSKTRKILVIGTTEHPVAHSDIIRHYTVFNLPGHATVIDRVTRCDVAEASQAADVIKHIHSGDVEILAEMFNCLIK